MIEAHDREMMFLCCDILIGIVKVQMKLCGGCRNLGHVVDGHGEQPHSRKVVEETLKRMVGVALYEREGIRLSGWNSR